MVTRSLIVYRGLAGAITIFRHCFTSAECPKVLVFEICKCSRIYSAA